MKLILWFAGSLVATAVAPAQISFGPMRVLTDYIWNPRHVRVHDIDQDGDLDVIAAQHYSVRVVWWENLGDGEFAAGREWLWGGLYPTVIAIDDADQDGILEVWIEREEIDTNEWEVLVAHGDAAGGFSEPVVVLNTTVDEDVSGEVRLVDLDGNSRPDILTAQEVYLDDGAGSFREGVPFTFYFDFDDVMEVVDVDGDGRADLLLSDDSDGSIKMIRNSGGGAFVPPVPFLEEDPSRECWSLVALTSEPAGMPPDLLAGFEVEDGEEFQNSITAFASGPGGAYLPAAHLELPKLQDGLQYSSWKLFRDPHSARFFLTAFVRQEAAQFRTTRTQVIELLWDGTDLSLLPLLDSPSAIQYNPPIAADLNGDSRADLLLPLTELPFATGPFYDQIVWRAGLDDGQFGDDERPVSEAALERALHFTGDFDGDGDGDFLTGGAESLNYPTGQRILTLWENTDGTGTMRPTRISGPFDWLRVVAVLDVVGDPGSRGENWPAGRIDLLVQTLRFNSIYDQTPQSRIQWVLQGNDGSYSWIAATPESVVETGAEYRYADWDGDGISDLVIRGAFQGWFGVGLTAWRKGTGIEFGELQVLGQNSGESSFDVIDMDWDGDLDILSIGNLFGFNTGYWHENDGTGSITTVHRLPAPLARANADLDGDGREDFILGGSEQAMYVLARSGVQIALPPGNPIATPWATLIDVDADGDVDEVFAPVTEFTTGYQALGWRENRGGGHFEPLGWTRIPEGPLDLGPAYLPIATARWGNRRFAGLADLDGDGARDLVIVSGYAPRVEWYPTRKAVTPPPFQAWMAEQNLTGHSAGPLSDWDRDQLLNWTEFAFGSDPSVQDGRHPSLPTLGRSSNGLEYSYERRLDASAIGLRYHDRFSSTLESWGELEGERHLLEGEPDYERVVITIDPAASPAGFVRTEISLPEEP